MLPTLLIFFQKKKGVQSISELAGEEQTGHWAQNCKKKDVFKYLGVCTLHQKKEYSSTDILQKTVQGKRIVKQLNSVL